MNAKKFLTELAESQKGNPKNVDFITYIQKAVNGNVSLSLDQRAAITAAISDQLTKGRAIIAAIGIAALINSCK